MVTRSHNKALFATLCLMLTTCAEGVRATPLSDKDAKQIVQENWVGWSETIPLGAYLIADSRNLEGRRLEPEKRIINDKFLPYLTAWEKVGIISISHDKSIDDKKYDDVKKGIMDFGQIQWQHFQGIVVSATEKGFSVNKASGNKETNCIKVLHGTFSVTDIVKNEQKNDGVTEYRVVMLKYHAKWTAEMLAWAQVFGASIKEKRKAMVLLKYDPFASKWTLRAIDIANEDEEFTTEEVSSIISTFH